MLAKFNLKAMGHNSSQYVHTLAEVLKPRSLTGSDITATARGAAAELLSPTYLRGAQRSSVLTERCPRRRLPVK